MSTKEHASEVSSAEQAVLIKRTRERFERMSEWTSEWPSTDVWNLGYSGPLCMVAITDDNVDYINMSTMVNNSILSA